MVNGNACADEKEKTENEEVIVGELRERAVVA